LLARLPFGPHELGEQRRRRGAIALGGGQILLEPLGDHVQLQIEQQLLQVFIHRHYPQAQ
jgi:hypothetical protein